MVKKIVRGMLVIFSGFLVAFGGAELSFAASTAADIADGTYNVNITALELDSDEVHLQDSSLVKPAQVTVSNGTITVYMQSKGRLLKFLDASTGTYVDYSINGTGDDSGDYTSDYAASASKVREYQFTVTDLAQPIEVQFPAGQSASGYLTYRLSFDTSGLTAAAADETQNSGTETTDSAAGAADGTAESGAGTTSEQTTNTSAASQKVLSPQTGDNLPILILSAVALTGVGIAGIFFTLRKKTQEK